jgi:hypothetical protein
LYSIASSTPEIEPSLTPAELTGVAAKPLGAGHEPLAMVMVNDTAAEGPSLLDAVTSKETKLAAVVGVPEITPLLSSVSPAGNAPPVTVQIVGLLVAASVSLYGSSTLPPVNAPAGVVIAGGVESIAALLLLLFAVTPALK